jgi:hypothetical protein
MALKLVSIESHAFHSSKLQAHVDSTMADHLDAILPVSTAPVDSVNLDANQQDEPALLPNCEGPQCAHHEAKEVRT